MKVLKLLLLSFSLLFVFGCKPNVAAPVDVDNSPSGSEATPEEMEVWNGQTVNDHYIDYTPEMFTAGSLSKRVLFFHASWCPTCKVANEDLEANEDQLPDDVVVFKLDYDTEDELKKKYGITYQHSFVYVDADGEAIRKWNGGGVEEVIQNVK